MTPEVDAHAYSLPSRSDHRIYRRETADTETGILVSVAALPVVMLRNTTIDHVTGTQVRIRHPNRLDSKILLSPFLVVGNRKGIKELICQKIDAVFDELASLQNEGEDNED
jgi:hypothetical protein